MWKTEKSHDKKRTKQSLKKGYTRIKQVNFDILLLWFVNDCYSPPMLSTNRHRILSIRYWLCQPIGILFCQRNEMLLRKTKAINPITNLAHKQIAASSRFESGWCRLCNSMKKWYNRNDYTLERKNDSCLIVMICGHNTATVSKHD